MRLLCWKLSHNAHLPEVNGAFSTISPCTHSLKHFSTPYWNLDMLGRDDVTVIIIGLGGIEQNFLSASSGMAEISEERKEPYVVATLYPRPDPG